MRAISSKSALFSIYLIGPDISTHIFSKRLKGSQNKSARERCG
jgi:hypothetical protein